MLAVMHGLEAGSDAKEYAHSGQIKLGLVKALFARCGVLTNWADGFGYTEKALRG